MTVQELMDQLRTLPPGHSVHVEGYETGWDDLVAVKAARSERQIPCEEWDGEFEAHPVDAASSNAVLLVGRRGHLREA